MTGDDWLADLAAAIGGAPTGHIPTELCRTAADLIDVDDVSFAFIGRGTARHTLGASSERSVDLDRWQFTLGEGPCIDAAASGRPVVSPVTDPDASPWPELAGKALDLGYDLIGGVPLVVAGSRVGALNLQSRAPQLAERALQVALEVVHGVADPIVRRFAEQPPGPGLGGHETVHLASGMVSVHLRVSVEDALVALRARAWRDDRPVADVAADVVAGEPLTEP